MYECGSLKDQQMAAVKGSESSQCFRWYCSLEIYRQILQKHTRTLRLKDYRMQQCVDSETKDTVTWKGSRLIFV
jgi:hypothetical protein